MYHKRVYHKRRNGQYTISASFVGRLFGKRALGMCMRNRATKHGLEMAQLSQDKNGRYYWGKPRTRCRRCAKDILAKMNKLKIKRKTKRKTHKK